MANELARPFDAELLACALTLTGTTTPTPDELAAALAEMYPGGACPTVPDLLAAGWLVPAVSDRARLRQPPLTPAEAVGRLGGEANNYKYQHISPPKPDKTRHFHASSPANSREFAGKNGAVPAAPCQANSRNEAGIDTELSELSEKADSRRKAGTAGPLFSYYRGGIAATVPQAAMTPAGLFAELTSGRHRAATEALRAAPVGSPQRAELKKRLDYVTPAGTFTRRANDALAVASGLLVLDFDHLPDVAAARAALLADTLLAPDLVLLFTSPSGDGLKLLARTDLTASHLDNFRAYADYLGRTYASLSLCPDEAGKDVARACFVPHAPDAWLAPAYAA